MTTRRSVLRLAGAVPAAALLGACVPRRTPQRAPEAQAPPPSRPKDLLLVETTTGLAIVDADTSRFVLDPGPGETSYDGTALATVVTVEGRARISVLGLDGQLWYGAETGGLLSPRAVSPGGSKVALVAGPDARPASVYRPAGRRETTIVVVDSSGERHRVTVPGCVEPEAFSPLSDSLYVLDYLPPRAPDRYRVRVLDLATGQLQALSTRDKKPIPPGAEEEMRGQGRQAVYSPRHRMLFTLYTHQPDHRHTRDLLAARPGHPDVHAFVHSLSVDAAFAYCVDLPAPFGAGPVESHAIALSPRGEHPIVVDGTSGTVAHIDGGELTVRSTAQYQGGGDAGAVAAFLADAGQRLVVASKSAVHVMRADSLSTVARWPLAAPARGAALSADGKRIWVGRNGGAVALDMASGREVASVTVDGLTGLTGVAADA
jgi:hypothetical protein